MGFGCWTAKRTPVMENNFCKVMVQHARYLAKLCLVVEVLWGFPVKFQRTSFLGAPRRLIFCCDFLHTKS